MRPAPPYPPPPSLLEAPLAMWGPIQSPAASPVERGGGQVQKTFLCSLLKTGR